MQRAPPPPAGDDDAAMAVQDERTAEVRPAPARPVTHVSTRALRPRAEVPRRTPGRRLRMVVPARLRIMAWLVLLLAASLLTVVVVTRNLLAAEARADAVSALEQEAGEFRGFAEAGVQDPLGALTRVCDLWASLCHLLGVPIPEDVLAATKKVPWDGPGA